MLLHIEYGILDTKFKENHKFSSEKNKENPFDYEKYE